MSFADLNTLTDRHADTFCYTQTEIDAIISQYNDPENPFDKDDTLLKRHFESLRKKAVQYTLHSTTLVEYLKTKRIPRGLRLNIRPSFCRDDKEFCNRWYQILNKCSLDLMTLTVKGIQGQLEGLNKTILETQRKLETQIPITDFQKYLETVTASVDQYRRDTLTIKLKKYRRDLIDYEEGRVYSWREHIRFRRNDDTRPSSRAGTDGNTSSDSDRQPFLGHPSRGPPPRRRGGARNETEPPYTRSQARLQTS